MPGHHGGARHLERDGCDVRASLGPHYVGQSLDEQAMAAIGRLGLRAVCDVLGLEIFRARHNFLRLAIPPRVVDHAVCVRERAGGDGRVAGAGHRPHVRVGRVPKPRAVGNQAFQPGRPVVLKVTDVVAAHLIDDDDDSQLGDWPRGSAALPDRSSGRQENRKCRDRPHPNRGTKSDGHETLLAAALCRRRHYRGKLNSEPARSTLRYPSATHQPVTPA